nr:uncharacterized protein LOC110364106 isoform X2 [Columba livia]
MSPWCWGCWRQIAAENGSVSIISVRHLAECGKKMILISSVLHPKKRFHEAQHLTAAFNTARYITGCPAKQISQLGQRRALARTHIPSQAVGGCTRKPLCSNGDPPWCREEPWEGATSTSSYGETNSDQLQKQHQESPASCAGGDTSAHRNCFSCHIWLHVAVLPAQFLSALKHRRGGTAATVPAPHPNSSPTRKPRGEILELMCSGEWI